MNRQIAAIIGTFFLASLFQNCSSGFHTNTFDSTSKSSQAPNESRSDSNLPSVPPASEGVMSKYQQQEAAGDQLTEQLGFLKTPQVSPMENWKGINSFLVFNALPNENYVNAGGKRISPVFLSVNPQAIPITDEAGWDILVKEVDTAIAAGINVINIMLKNKSLPHLQKLSEKIGNRDVYFIVRFDLWFPDFKNLNQPIFESLSAQRQTGNWVGNAVDRNGVKLPIPVTVNLDYDWLAMERKNLANLISDLNQTPLAAKIIALEPTFQNGGEWFNRYFTFDANNQLTDYSDKNPVTSPAEFFLGNYSASEQKLFSDWLIKKKILTTAIPSTAYRSTARYGQSFVLNAEDGKNAVLYKQFQSERIVWLQSEIARTLKRLTNYKTLVMVPQGYLYALSFENGSYHSAFSKILKSPFIDLINAPYNYEVEGSRKVGNPFIPHGPVDSVLLHNKMWMHEDDGRPYWYTETFKTTNSFQEDISLAARNAAAAIAHGSLIYLFDLGNKGWYGGLSERAGEAAEMWKQMNFINTHVVPKLGEGSDVKAEVAIFVDDSSYDLYKEFGIAGINSYEISQQLVPGMILKIASQGSPVKYYLLSDLLLSNINLDYIKLAFFLNTAKITTDVASAIKNKLMNSERVLYFQHAAGYFNQNLSPSYVNAQAFVSTSGNTITLIDGNSEGVLTTETMPEGYVRAYSPKGIVNSQVKQLFNKANVHRYAVDKAVEGKGAFVSVHSSGGAFSFYLNKIYRDIYEMTSAGPQLLCSNCQNLNLSSSGAKTWLLHLAPNAKFPTVNTNPTGLFKYEWIPGGFGGSHSKDGINYCSFSDGAHLAQCGFNADHYAAAPTYTYGSIFLNKSGKCACPIQ
jgi:hypothetical protein